MSLFQFLRVTNLKQNEFLSAIYEIHPFNVEQSRQTPGNVVQYILIKMKEFGPDNEWQAIFLEKIQPLIAPNINTFTAKEISILIHSLSHFSYSRNVFDAIVPSLLNKLIQLIDVANSQDIANTIWAIATLVQQEKLSNLSENAIIPLIARFYTIHAQAIAVEISSVLWSIATLVDKNILQRVDETAINAFILQFHNFISDERLFNAIAISLSSIATLIETRKLQTMNAVAVSEFFVKIAPSYDALSRHYRIKVLWAYAIISNTYPQVFVDKQDAIQTILNCTMAIFMQYAHYNRDRNTSMLLIQALGMMQYNGIFPLEAWITVLRPAPNLSDDHFRRLDRTQIQTQAFLHGFFVDLLTTNARGKQVAIFVDTGPYTPQKSARDLFRDNFLNNLGYDTVHWNGHEPLPAVLLSKTITAPLEPAANAPVTTQQSSPPRYSRPTSRNYLSLLFQPAREEPRPPHRDIGGTRYYTPQ